MKKIPGAILLFVLPLIFLNLLCSTAFAGPGDTTKVQVFTFDSDTRSGMYTFPSDVNKRYEKIIMRYGMRCKDGLVSTGSNTNLGCGEWDYNNYTSIVDSSQTDSLRLTAPNWTISGFNGTNFNFTNTPTFTYQQIAQQIVSIDTIFSEDSVLIGTNTQPGIQPFNASPSRNQYLFTATELLAGGFAAGNIHGIRLELGQIGSNLPYFLIRMKQTAASALDPYNPELNGFTTVLSGTFNPQSGGWYNFTFSQPFNWNGTDNLLIEFISDLQQGSITTEAGSENSSFQSRLSTTFEDQCLAFYSPQQKIVVPTSVGQSITDEVSVAFWVNGNASALPANTTILEGTDSSGSRQINVHLPWSDSNIYWDCGNDGSGYDRINKAATTAEIEGQWNFWVFTKNASAGTMKIYLNGNLWHSGTGKTKPINIDLFEFGRSIGGSLGYYGKVNEISIWNKELSQSALDSIMHIGISGSNPYIANLKAYYPVSGSQLIDASPMAQFPQSFFMTYNRIPASERYMNYTASSLRPVIQFLQGSYATTVTTQFLIDSVPNNPSLMISYFVDSGNNLVIADTLIAWASGNMYTYNQNGVIVDTLVVPADSSIAISTLTYYQRRPMKLELLNFITPYGINLNMNGLVGRFWEIDVTDFAPVLKGRKFITMEGAPYQEDMDVSFIFYEGIPPRDVKNIRQIWPAGNWVSPSYNDITANNFFEPRTVLLDAGSSFFKIRSQISGHGQEGEFIPRTHTLSVNASSFARNVWTPCGENPIYPQGGTWVYDRAGWCPGAEVDWAHYELSGLVTPGQTATMDYSLPPNGNPGNSNYRVNNQLVSYGPINHTSDARLEAIQSPSNRTEFMRLNPVCDNPVVRIQNTGSSPISTLEIKYGRVDGTLLTHTWIGNLNFLETASIELPQPNYQSSSTPAFIAYITKVNGTSDQYAWNDTLVSRYDGTSYLPNNIVIEFKSNNNYWENEYTLEDASGQVLLTRAATAANQFIRDTLNLPAGCYTLRLSDTGNDGLSFWANSAQGNGLIRIKNPSSGGIFRNFGADFGASIHHQFTVNYILAEEERMANVRNLHVFPVPADDVLYLELSGVEAGWQPIQISDLSGRIVSIEQFRLAEGYQKIQLDISTLSKGAYTVQAGGLRKNFIRN